MKKKIFGVVPGLFEIRKLILEVVFEVESIFWQIFRAPSFAVCVRAVKV